MDEKEFHTFGPPGTGKTTWLIKQIERACGVYHPAEIIVASFTRAAARELVSRGVPVPEENVGTLHALCHRVLGRPRIAETKIKDFNEHHPQFAITSSGHDLAGEMCDGSGNDIMSLYQILRAKCIPFDDWPTNIKEFHNVWNRWCYQNSYTDFTGLIEDAIAQNAPPPNGAVIGFFDEAQDFTSLEFSLVRQWTKYMDKSIFVGDDDQSIYGFKGGDPDAFINYTVPEKNKIFLRTSYRLPSAVLGYSKRWIEQVKNREQKEFSPKFEGGSVKEISASYKNTPPLIDALREVIENGETAMVLASCSYMLDKIKDALVEEGIPFHNPYRRSRADWNPLARSRAGGSSATLRLLRFFMASGEKTGIAMAPGEVQEFWTDRGEPLWTVEQAQSIFDVFKASMLFRRGAAKKLKLMSEPRPFEEGYHPVFQNKVLEFLHEWTLDDKLGEISKATMEQDLDWFAKHLVAAKIKPFERVISFAKKNSIWSLANEPKIVIGTIHSVKGGEADNVFLFPDISPNAAQSYILGGGAKDDTLRQFYVGMTRSRKNVFLCEPVSKFKVDWINV